MSEQIKPGPLKTEITPAVGTVSRGGQEIVVVQSWLIWSKRFLACNPFYLVSAALLLFGMNRALAEPDFLRTELAQLVFSYSALQLYELLLVGTAIVLAWRAVWYDSTLLLVLENLFVLVPFMLVSQAALVQQKLIWIFCGLTVVLVGMRMGAARRFLVGFSPSPRLLLVGLGVLVTNAAWPVIYRHLHEFKVGTRPTSGAAYAVNELSWLWLLPLLCALTSLLPHPRVDGKLLVQRRWFPVALSSLWLAGTGVHLYSLGYVYDFALRRELLAPALCVLAWVLHLRLEDFVAERARKLHALTLALPIAAALLAANTNGNRVCFALMCLNVTGFALKMLLSRQNQLAGHLFIVSMALLVATFPGEWAGTAIASLSPRLNLIVLAVAAYLVLRSTVSRDPKLAILGAVAAASLLWVWARPADAALHWAVQGGLIYYLLHSLRWRDYEHEGAAAARILTAIGWVAHSFVWARSDAPFWQPPATATLVVTVCWIHWWVRQKRLPLVIPVAATLVAILVPVNMLFTALAATPAGVVAIVGSFALFAVGTAAAFTKQRWCKPAEVRKL